ncbi:MAG: hypothetical protein AAF585_03450 [Verrucomicrobiota bacterium]
MLKIAYAANILILIPVALGTLLSKRGAEAVFEAKFETDTPLRILVGSFWTAILICSIIGLFRPNQMVGILFLQVIYKSLFLAFFAAPAIRHGGLSAIPTGLCSCFLLIVLVWPVMLWLTADSWLPGS